MQAQEQIHRTDRSIRTHHIEFLALREIAGMMQPEFTKGNVKRNEVGIFHVAPNVWADRALRIWLAATYSRAIARFNALYGAFFSTPSTAAFSSARAPPRMSSIA